MDVRNRFFISLLIGLGVWSAADQSAAQTQADIVVTVALPAEDLTISRAIEGGPFYPIAGGIVQVTVEFNGSVGGSLVSLDLAETIPAGWTYESFVGDKSMLLTSPAPGESGALYFEWQTPPTSMPASITYRLNVPSGELGDKQISGAGSYNIGLPNDSYYGPVQTMLSTCVVPPAPTGINASDGASNTHIQLNWNAVPGAAMYEVYRNTNNVPGSALLIATVSDTHYEDFAVVARSNESMSPPVIPVVNSTDMENGPPIVGLVVLLGIVTLLLATRALAMTRYAGATPNRQFAAYGIIVFLASIALNCAPTTGAPTTYYYWVKAVSVCGPASEFSQSDPGYLRGNANKDQPMFEAALPATDALWDRRLVTPGETVYMRLRTETPVDESTVWAGAMINAPVAGSVYWVPIAGTDFTDGWIAFEPDDPWPSGATIAVMAGARTDDDEFYNAIPQQFEVVSAVTGRTSVLEQPDYDPSSGVTDAIAPEPNAYVLTLDIAPQATEASIIYDIGPPEAFVPPRRVWLPVPENFYPDDRIPMYRLDGKREDATWYPIDEMEGFVIPDSYLYLDSSTGYWLGFLVNHGGSIALRSPDV